MIIMWFLSSVVFVVCFPISAPKYVVQNKYLSIVNHNPQFVCQKVRSRKKISSWWSPPRIEPDLAQIFTSLGSSCRHMSHNIYCHWGILIMMMGLMKMISLSHGSQMFLYDYLFVFLLIDFLLDLLERSDSQHPVARWRNDQEANWKYLSSSSSQSWSS